MTHPHKNFITIVSGLPRSGTSMMMRMLQNGGMKIITDSYRTADTNNPLGYFEFEPVKKLRENNRWLGDAPGKGVKIVNHFLQFLPNSYSYKIIFVQRNLHEIIQSQNKMLKLTGKNSEVPDEKIYELLKKDLAKTKAQLLKRKDMKVVFVDYGQIIEDPLKEASRINNFLGSNLNISKMALAVDSNLYRNRL